MTPTTKRRLQVLIFWILVLLLLLAFPRKAEGQIPTSSNKQDGQAEQKTEKKKKLDPKDDPDQIGQRDIGRGINFYSLEKEIAIGKGLAEEIEKTVKLIDDPLVSEYINRVGQNIVRNSDAKVPFAIKVIDAAEVNAFALPGGFFFINAGLILQTETEAELAGVMAHEVAHVAARHGTRQATKAGVANIASLPLILLGGWGGYGIRQAAGVLIPMQFLKFSRDFEREADSLAVQYLYKTGYDPLAMVDIFERIESLEKRKPGAVSKIFLSHPTTGERIKRVQESIKILPDRPDLDYAINTSGFVRAKGELEKIFGRKKTEKEPTGPTLRKKPSGKIEPGEEGKEKEEKEERPTLKRRP